MTILPNKPKKVAKSSERHGSQQTGLVFLLKIVEQSSAS